MTTVPLTTLRRAETLAAYLAALERFAMHFNDRDLPPVILRKFVDVYLAGADYDEACDDADQQ